MKLDLNTISGGSTIFNGGVAGKVDNTTIDVEKKSSTDPDTYPDYKLVVKDTAGKTINQGFYYPTMDDSKSEEDNMKVVNRNVGRVLSIAKAVVGDNYEFPEVSSPKEAFDVLFKIIKDNSGDKKFSVYATYGTKTYPSKFLGLRYFSFIEPTQLSEGKRSVLTPNPNDLMERITEDAPKSSGSKKDEDWF